MSNRGAHRGIVRQAGPSDLRDATAPTVPQPAVGARRRTRPVGTPERPPGGTSLDRYEQQQQQHAENPTRSNWRDLVHRITRITRIDLGPGKDAAYETGLRERIRRDVGGAVPVAVLNLKGGVGKTAVVEALGSTFADTRDDRVIALDINAGDLVHRHGRPNPLTMADLLADNTVARYSDVRAHTYMNNVGLEVLGLPDYAQTDWRLQRRHIVKAFSILRNHYSLLLVDCDKGLKAGVTEAVLRESQALVLVTTTSIDAVRKTRTTLEWLRRNGYQRMIKRTVLAVNYVDPAGLETLAGKELEDIAARVRATVLLPFDRHVHEGKEIELDRLSRESRRSYLELAAALADMFRRPHVEQDFPAALWRPPRGS